MKSSSVTAKLSQARPLDRSIRPCRWRSTVRSSSASSPVYAFGRSITFATPLGAMWQKLPRICPAAVDGERLRPEDRGMHAAQKRARLEPQLLDEQLASLAVGLERLRLPAGAVEGEHQLGPQPLAQRMGADEPLELGDELRVRADRELRLRPLLDQREMELLEPRDLLPGERLVPELLQWLASPQRERVV